jgi:hypothetical protein
MRRGSRHGLDSMVVALEGIESVIQTCFRFSAALYDGIDRFKRHQRFMYNVGDGRARRIAAPVTICSGYSVLLRAIRASPT